MRSRTDSGSRCTWWCANIAARAATSLNASSISCSVTCGSARAARPIAQLGARLPDVALEARQRIDDLGRARLKRSYSCSRRTSSARGSSSPSSPRRGRPRQQHARLDLGQRRGHHQILAGELELQFLHQLDVLHVLAGDLGDRDVENVDVLPADQVQQQIERPSKASRKISSACGGMYRSRGSCVIGSPLIDRERHLHLLGRAALRPRAAAGRRDLGLASLDSTIFSVRSAAVSRA